jgi:hypothetical protein
MSSRDLLIWSTVGIFVIAPAVALARWRTVAARRLVDRLLSELRARGEQPTEKERKAFIAELLLSSWKTRALTIRVQGVIIPDSYLREWADIDRRLKRLRLAAIVVAVVALVVLKNVILSD